MKTSWIKKITHIKTWQLVIILLIFIVLCATFLRMNNVGFVQLRRAAIAADEAGNTEQIHHALFELSRYSAQHMNADNPSELYLQGMYDREVKRLYEAAKSDKNANGNIFVAADTICKERYSGWSRAYVQCVADEQAKYAPSAAPETKITMPNTLLYRHAYKSPLWSNDFAGWSLLGAIVISLIIIGRIIEWIIVRIAVKTAFRKA